MRPYLDLLRRVYTGGEDAASRAVLRSTGERPRTRSSFGEHARYDLRDGFPLATTKFVPFGQVAAELLWMLSGSENIRPLQAQGVRIWDAWADEGGDLGPVYGRAWRRWPDQGGWWVDQVGQLVRDLASVREDPEHPAARRLLLTAWNPADLRSHLRSGRANPAPLGCHTLAQFSVRPDRRLDCHLYQRSGDLFLGVPWNVASYALLTHLLAHVTGLEAGVLHHSFGDAHIYANHFDQVEEQLSREPLPLPRLAIDPAVRTLEDATVERLQVEGYAHLGRIAGEVAV